MTRIYRLLIGVSLVVILTGCTLVDLSHDLKKIDRLVTITGTVQAFPESSGPIIVVLINDSITQPVATNYRVLKSSGKFHFLTEPGLYRIFAFEDINRDGKYNYAERVERSSMLEMNTPGKQKHIKLVLNQSADDKLAEEIHKIKRNGLVSFHELKLNLGQIISLDSDTFSRKNQRKGLWQPYRSVKEVPYGLFLLDDYAPNKKVVLFVHGISGSPAQFKSIINRLDHSRFQSMLVYYPSGFPLSLVGQYLNSLVEELHIKLGFEQVSVVAHSMGGLVSREFVNIQSIHNKSLVDKLITISTPWSGHASVTRGLKLSPVIIPVWRDMEPKSQFLNDLYLTGLSDETKHYLLFSFKGRSQVAGENSDSVVSIASQLRSSAQKDASLIRGFNEDHLTILESSEVSMLINQLLESKQ